MRFDLTFNMDNGAFEKAPEREIARILSSITSIIQRDGLTYADIRDINGNHIGEWEIVVDELLRLAKED